MRETEYHFPALQQASAWWFFATFLIPTPHLKLPSVTHSHSELLKCVLYYTVYSVSLVYLISVKYDEWMAECAYEYNVKAKKSFIFTSQYPITNSFRAHYLKSTAWAEPSLSNWDYIQCQSWQWIWMCCMDYLQFDTFLAFYWQVCDTLAALKVFTGDFWSCFYKGLFLVLNYTTHFFDKLFQSSRVVLKPSSKNVQVVFSGLYKRYEFEKVFAQIAQLISSLYSSKSKAHFECDRFHPDFIATQLFSCMYNKVRSAE